MRSLLSLALLFASALSCALPATAEVRTKVIEYEHAGVALEGFLAWDDAKASDKSPQPGVLVCPEWWGNNDYAHFRARKLAELGKPEDNARIKGTITVCHGQDDGFVSADEIAAFHAQMKAAKLDYQFLSYAYAVHAFTNPDAGKFKVPGVDYDAKADARSWEHMKLALGEAFASGAVR